MTMQNNVRKYEIWAHIKKKNILDFVNLIEGEKCYAPPGTCVVIHAERDTHISP
jgi:hypothetical protein